MLPDSIFDNVTPEHVYIKTCIIEYLEVPKNVKQILYKTANRTMYDFDSMPDRYLLAYDGIGKIRVHQIRDSLTKIRTQLFKKEREIGQLGR